MSKETMGLTVILVIVGVIFAAYVTKWLKLGPTA